MRHYRDGIFKVVKFKQSYGDSYRLPDEDADEEEAVYDGIDGKFSQSISRAKSNILDLALSNEWDWFATITLDSQKYNRYDLRTYKKDLTAWINQQNKDRGCKIKYLLVPEEHKDGAWHMHGLLRGIPDNCLREFSRSLGDPVRFCGHGWKLWVPYHRKFGLCSLSAVRSHFRVSFYITKYITKAVSSGSVQKGDHLYIPSRGLQRSAKIAEIYEPVPALDACLSREFQFLSTGFARDASFDWMCKNVFEYDRVLDTAELLDFSGFEPVDSGYFVEDSAEEPPESFGFGEVENILIEGW